MKFGTGRQGFAVLLPGILAVQGILLMIPGGLYVNGHEGDLLHTLEAADRIAGGQWPHVDFMTPLGLFAFGPIAAMQAAGLPPGQSVLAAYLLVAACLLPGIWHIGQSRMAPWMRPVFGLWMILLTTALVFGGDQATLSVSMYYNRWGWAIATLVVLAVLLPRREGTADSSGDGILIGLGMASLGLLKMTYFVSLAPAVLVFFVMNRAWRALGAAVVAALVAAVLVTLLVGDLWFWGRYLGDLLFVAGSGTRPKPGLEFADIVAGPANLPATAALMAAIVALRLGGRPKPGLLLLLLAPGFFFITYQNWGNDPQWLMILLFALLCLCPGPGQARFRGRDARPFILSIALIAGTLTAPSILNIGFSSLRGVFLDRGGYLQAVPGPRFADVFIEAKRSFKPVGQIDLPPIDTPELPPGEEDEAAQEGPVRVAGETLENCEAYSALVGVLRHVGNELSGIPEMRGAHLLTADILNNLWMFSAVARLDGGAPWYYGGRPGFAQADHLLVPLCPVSPKARRVVLSIVEKDGWNLREIRRTPHYILFRRLR
ncbi:MAG: hypothetical protein ACE5FS_00310 [Paracoccaceae bacterium]